MKDAKVCPIRTIALGLITVSITQASIAHPRYATELQGVVSGDDKNCNTHRCALWNKRSKQCGLIK